jgi:hypothetical protein
MKPIQPTSSTCALAVAAAIGLFAQPAQAQENFSAKPAPQLFASDCTGSGCHKGPQGLAKGQSQFGLATFLREHYTNSRESAAALASYLMRLPAEARTPRSHPSARSSRAAARPEEEVQPTPAARPHRGAEPPSQPARGQRGRQTTAVTVPTPVPPEPPEAAEPAAAPPPPKQFDIFD